MATVKVTFTQNIEAVNAKIQKQTKELQSDLYLLFSQTADVFNRYQELNLRKINQNKTTFGILHNLIGHGGSMTPTVLAERVFRSKHAVSRAVSFLEKEGLVKRGLIKGDLRLTKVSITQKGLDVVKDHFEESRVIITRTLSCLDKEKMEELRKTLTTFKTHILKITPASRSHPVHEDLEK